MISVIIPVYNSELYLSQCIQSVLDQTFTDFELILVNDGSTDSSPSICDLYAQLDKRIKVIHIPNSGVSNARNVGIDNALGEWIVFIDSDDFVENNYLELFHLENNDSDIVIQGLEYYNNITGDFFNPILLKNEHVTNDNLIKATANYKLLENGYPVAKAFRKNLLKKNNIIFNTNISFHEDHIFVLNCYNVARSFELSDGTAYKYRYYHTDQNLSFRRHSWWMLSLSADGMLASLNTLRNRFITPGTETEQRAFHFAYSPKVSAVNELFFSNEQYTEIKKHYHTIINREELRVMYHPIDMKGKLYRIVMLYMPFICIYIFFTTLVKYRNFRKYR